MKSSVTATLGVIKVFIEGTTAGANAMVGQMRVSSYITPHQPERCVYCIGRLIKGSISPDDVDATNAVHDNPSRDGCVTGVWRIWAACGTKT